MLAFLVWQEQFSKTINFIIFVVLPFVLKVKITKFKFVIFVTQVYITLFCGYADKDFVRRSRTIFITLQIILMDVVL